MTLIAVPVPGTRLKEQPPLGMSQVLGGSRIGNEMLFAGETHHCSQSRQRRSHRARRAKRRGVWGPGSGLTSLTHKLPALCSVCLVRVPSHYSVRSRGHPALPTGATQGTERMFSVDCVSAGCESVCPRHVRVWTGTGDTWRW